MSHKQPHPGHWNDRGKAMPVPPEPRWADRPTAPEALCACFCHTEPKRDRQWCSFCAPTHGDDDE